MECPGSLNGGSRNQAYVDRLQRIVGDRRNAEFAIALRPDDAALEERALIDNLEALADRRCQPHRKPGQRQPLPTRAAELGVRDPRRLPPFGAQCFEFDVARQEGIDRSDAEGLDAQLLPAVPDPSFPRKATVAGPFYMQHDFSSDFLRLARFIGREE